MDSTGFDRRDTALVKSAFWPDAQVSYGPTITSVNGFIEQHFAAHDAVSAYNQQFITEQSVDIEGDVAHVEADLIDFSTLKDGKSRIATVRYIDRLDRRNGEWRIAVREAILQFVTETDNNYVNWKKGKVYEAFLWSPCGMGTRDKTDPSYRRPLTARTSKDPAARCAEQ